MHIVEQPAAEGSSNSTDSHPEEPAPTLDQETEATGQPSTTHVGQYTRWRPQALLQRLVQRQQRRLRKLCERPARQLLKHRQQQQGMQQLMQQQQQAMQQLVQRQQELMQQQQEQQQQQQQPPNIAEVQRVLDALPGSPRVKAAAYCAAGLQPRGLPRVAELTPEQLAAQGSEVDFVVAHDWRDGTDGPQLMLGLAWAFGWHPA